MSSPKVEEAMPLDDYTILLTFTNGEKRLYDAAPLLKGSVFKPLKNRGFFKLVKPDGYGGIVWPGEIDLCYHSLYPKSKPLS